MSYPCHRTLPQLPQFSISMNLYFVYVINIRFICDEEMYLLTYLLRLWRLDPFPAHTIALIALGLHMPRWHNFGFPYLNAERLQSLAQKLFLLKAPLSQTSYITSFSCQNIISNYLHTCGYNFLISCGINILILCAFSFSAQWNFMNLLP